MGYLAGKRRANSDAVLGVGQYDRSRFGHRIQATVERIDGLDHGLVGLHDVGERWIILHDERPKVALEVVVIRDHGVNVVGERLGEDAVPPHLIVCRHPAHDASVIHGSLRVVFEGIVYPSGLPGADERHVNLGQEDELVCQKLVVGPGEVDPHVSHDDSTGHLPKCPGRDDGRIG